MGGKSRWISEYKASLIYIVSSRTGLCRESLSPNIIIKPGDFVSFPKEGSYYTLRLGEGYGFFFRHTAEDTPILFVPVIFRLSLGHSSGTAAILPTQLQVPLCTPGGS